MGPPPSSAQSRPASRYPSSIGAGRRLPPLPSSSSSSSTANRLALLSPRPAGNRSDAAGNGSSSTPGSRFHNNCRHRSPSPRLRSPSKRNQALLSAAGGGGGGGNGVESLSIRGQSPIPIRTNGALRFTSGFSELMTSETQDFRWNSAAPTAATADGVVTYLRDNPEILEEYVMNEVDVELLERWIIRKSAIRQRNRNRSGGGSPSDGSAAASVSSISENGTGGGGGGGGSSSNTLQANGKITRKTSLSRWKFCVHADKRKMLQELTQSLQVKPNKGHVLWELGNCIASAVNADGLNLYVVNSETQEVHYFKKDSNTTTPTTTTTTNNSDDEDIDGPFLAQSISAGSTLAAFVAKTRQTLRTNRPDQDTRFPDGVAVNADVARVVLCQPIVQSDGQLCGILELYRKEGGPEFFEEDEEIVQSYLVWGGIALHYAEMYYSMAKQRKLNDFLLNVVKSIFQDMVSMDMVIIKVMNFAQKLVSADRASLFLVDHRSRELYARIFDMGSNSSNAPPTNSNGQQQQQPPSVPTSTKEIRFPIGVGIAGRVAESGEVLNIPDAYRDPRFNREVDQQTGYLTRSILCMPIFIRGQVIGVVQMVNKHSGRFTSQDEEAFEVFANYCGLALHHAKLYDKIRRSEQKYKVAMEVLSYHYTCSEEEACQLQTRPNLCGEMVPNLDDFYFSTNSLNGDQKTGQSVLMFKDLFGMSRFDFDSLVRFSLTVRKNYRRVPYHNWNHGFTVANSAYAVLKKTIQTVFNELESLALYIGCMCHDLDHRGKTNKFMLDTASPLAIIYSTSTLEHHHFNQTVSILQQQGHNIFRSLSSEEYKIVLGEIRYCILATDLAQFFPNKAKLQGLLDRNEFSWDRSDHRHLAKAIMMTACDLCASSKPWEQQIETVKVIFEEFYEQGDLEKAAGRVPMPMMDRSKKDQQPSTQVDFLKGICIPCYELLYAIIPDTKPMLDGCRANLEKWQELADQVKEGNETVDARAADVNVEAENASAEDAEAENADT